jgi:stage III sporulation protein AF
MSEVLRSWVIGIAGAAMVTAAAMTVTPEGRVKKVVSLICGLVTIIALLRPIGGLDSRNLLKSIEAYKQEATAFSAEIQSADENLTRRIIAEKSAAYILDKGESLGIGDLDVSVTTAWSEDGYWYPDGAVLKTSADNAARDQLSRSIETELGIPPEELIWSMNDES